MIKHEKERRNKTKEMTRFMVHKYYCDREIESVIALLDEKFSWIGTGEEEYAVGKEKVSDLFRSFIDNVIKCDITHEEYNVICIKPDVYLCSGRMWITTDPSTGVYLQVHQRITTVFCFTEDQARCCHIHISNPYIEMTEDDSGFPTVIARQSYDYMQRKLRSHEQKLLKISYEDSLTGLYNRNRFNKDINSKAYMEAEAVGVACFDMNHLKKVNDSYGHGAGDRLLCQAAAHIRAFFDKKAYRIGGDEFIVIDRERDEESFYKTVESVQKNMEKDRISCSVGACFRTGKGQLLRQIHEADRLMYEEKKKYHDHLADQD